MKFLLCFISFFLFVSFKLKPVSKMLPSVFTCSTSVTSTLTGICPVWGICFRGGRVGQRERGRCVLSGCMIQNHEGSIPQALLLVRPTVCTGLHVWGDVICLVLFQGEDRGYRGRLTGFIWISE